MRRERPVNVQSGNAAPKLVALIVAVAVIACGFWFYTQKQPEPEKTFETEAPAPAPSPAIPDTVEQAPDIPELVEPETMEEPAEPAVELPPLEESDSFARQTLEPLSQDPEFSLWIQTDNLMQKFAAIIDGFSKGNVLRKIIPVQPPETPFEVTKEDDRIFLDSSNYQRFDTLVDTLTAISPESLANAFQGLRPLLEEAYSALGNPGDKVDNSLIAAIDLALQTPEVSEPIALKHESVLYQFADPELEALPPLQKQLIRIGPDNQKKVKAYLTDVRAALLGEDESPILPSDPS